MFFIWTTTRSTIQSFYISSLSYFLLWTFHITTTVLRVYPWPKTSILSISNQIHEEVFHIHQVAFIQERTPTTRPSSKIWICVDYRKLNLDTIYDSFSLPFMDNIMDTVVEHEIDSFLNRFNIENQRRVPIVEETLSQFHFVRHHTSKLVFLYYLQSRYDHMHQVSFKVLEYQLPDLTIVGIWITAYFQ